MDFPGGSDSKESAYNVGDPGSIPELGRSGEENGNPLQYSCLGNPTDGGAWRVTVHGVAKQLDVIQPTNNNLDRPSIYARGSVSQKFQRTDFSGT